MLEYKREELAEKDLENKIIKYPGLIEDGLQYLEHQRHTSTGRLDILFADSNGTIAVAELKVVEDPHMLFQALDYFDFVAEKIEGFSRIYKNLNIDVEQYPRLILIAPSFSPVMINRCRWLNPDIQITLYVYQYITFPKTKEDTLVFIPQEISVRPTVLKKAPDLNKLLGYIKNKDIRDFAKQILNKTQSLSSDVTVDPLQWGKSVKYKGSVLYYWEPRKACIRITTTNEDGNWEGVNVEKEDDYIEAMNLIKKNMGKYE